MYVIIELTKLIYVVPYFFIICVKYVGTVFVYVNSFYFFCVAITPNMISYIYDKALLSCSA